MTALKALDSEFEAVSASLRCRSSDLLARHAADLHASHGGHRALFLRQRDDHDFSAVVFLYSPGDQGASIAILNLDEAGEIGAAAAMAVMIAAISAVATGASCCSPAGSTVARRRGARSLPAFDRYALMSHDRILSPRPPDHAANQARHAARLGLMGCRVQRRHCARTQQSLLAVVHGEDTRCGGAPAGQWHVQRRGCGRDGRARDGHVLVLDNGAYCKRAAKLTTMMDRRCTVMPFADDAGVAIGADAKSWRVTPASPMWC